MDSSNNNTILYILIPFYFIMFIAICFNVQRIKPHLYVTTFEEKIQQKQSNLEEP